MKQLKHLVLYLPFVLAAVGCSQDELTPDGGTGTGVPEGLHEVEITFSVGANAGLQTRATAAPRPLEGPENWQRVTNMRIYVFRSENGGTDDDYTYYKPQIGGVEKDYLYVSDFYNTKVGEDGTISNTWGDETSEEENEMHTVTTKMKLKNGYYKFLAVGRDDIIEDNPSQSQIRMTDPNMGINQYPENFIENIRATNEPNAPTFDDSLWDNETSLSFAFITSGYNETASELFSGCSASVHVQESGGLSTSIELKRAVAGMLFYVTNVPTELEAKATMQKAGNRGSLTNAIEKGTKYPVNRIGIALITRNADVVLSTRYFLPEVHDTHYYYSSLNRIQNNTEANESYYSWFKTTCIFHDMGNTDSQDGYYTGTYTAGGFVMPQLAPTKINGGTTLTVGTEGTENLTHTLYLVFFHLPSGSQEYYAIDWRPIKIKSSKDSEGNSLPTEETYDFDILANQLYSLGTKDFPIDLKEDNSNLVITVNPNWDWKGELEWAD